jgi:phage baseplate assembly protein V
MNGVQFLTGVVCAVDPKVAKARVRFAELDGLESAFIPVGQRKTHEDKDYWMVDVGDQVSCLMDEFAEDGVILCAIYSAADTPPVDSADKRHVRFKDGTTVEYDRASGEMKVQCVGKIVLQVDGDFSVKAGGNVRIEAAGTLDIEAGGAIRVVGATVDLN